MVVSEIRELYLKVLGNIKSVMIGNEEVSSLIFSGKYKRRFQTYSVHSGSYASGYYRS